MAEQETELEHVLEIHRYMSRHGRVLTTTIGAPKIVCDEVTRGMANIRLFSRVAMSPDHREIAVARFDEPIEPEEGPEIFPRYEAIMPEGWHEIHSMARDRNIALLDIPEELKEDRTFIHFGMHLADRAIDHHGWPRGGRGAAGQKVLGLGYEPGERYAIIVGDLSTGMYAVLPGYDQGDSVSYAYANGYIYAIIGSGTNRGVLARTCYRELLLFANGSYRPERHWVECGAIALGDRQRVTALASANDVLIATVEQADGSVALMSFEPSAELSVRRVSTLHVPPEIMNGYRVRFYGCGHTWYTAAFVQENGAFRLVPAEKIDGLSALIQIALPRRRRMPPPDQIGVQK